MTVNIKMRQRRRRYSEEEEKSTIGDRVKQFNILLLHEESIRNFYKRRLDQNLEEFRHENIVVIYKHTLIKKIIKLASSEAFREKLNTINRCHC